jgi:PTS system mannose-specific IIA component
LPLPRQLKARKFLKTYRTKIKSLDKGQGVLILTDMFGGTPSNLSLSFLEDEMLEVLTGVNLPMVMAVAMDRDRLSLSELGVLV